MEKLKVEAIRVQLGLSREEFARMIGIGCEKTYRNKLEKRNWNMPEISKIIDLSHLKFENIDW